MATNTLGAYNPIFYAQEGLIALEKALGMANRVHRGYDAERRSFAKGNTISIKKPASFTAQSAPSAAQDLTTGTVDIVLDQWKDVNITLTDKDLALTGEQIITDHIQPAVYALADDIDAALCALEYGVPWYYDLSSSGGIADLTGAFKILFDNNVPTKQPGTLHFMLDSAYQAKFQNLAQFTSAYGAGQCGVDSLVSGSLGVKFGFELFANQNVASHTSGTCVDPMGAVVGAHYKGGETLAIDGITASAALKKGDTLVIASNKQRYSITANISATSAGTVTLAIFPPLVDDYDNDSVVTIRIDSHTSMLAFHRNAFALAMAPLSEIGNNLGAQIASITDPRTGLSMRSRMYYTGSAVAVVLDVLYGVKILDPNLALVACG